MVYFGTLKERKTENEYNGYSSFTLTTHSGDVVLNGVIPAYPVFIPLKVEAKKTDDGSLKSENITLCSESNEDTLRFLTSGYFSGIGEATARNVINACGTDIFGYVRDNGSEDETLSSRITDVLKKIQPLISFESAYSFIRGNNGSLYTAVKLYKKYHEHTTERLTANPYLYFYAGGDYAFCEKLAKKSGFQAFDEKRVRALVRYAIEKNRSYGNTVISYHELVKMCHRREAEIGAGYHTDPIFISRELIDNKKTYHLHKNEKDITIMLASDDNAESLIASEIKRLETSKVKISDGSVRTEDIEKRFGIEYSDGQRAVIEGIRESGVKIITGGPGTGKTTLLNGLLYRYRIENPGKKISLCSPTGCAAKRMKDATGMDASTIHRLLKIRPYEENIAAKSRDRLNADLIVVDETSMLDTKLAATFLTAVKNSATVIFLGDKDQLPSVDAGNVLGDLIESNALECYDLTEIFRQKHGSTITANARKVIAGNNSLNTDRSFIIKKTKNEKELIEELMKLENTYACYESKKKETHDILKVFTPSKNRKFKTGSISLNRLLKSAQGKAPDFTFGFYSYSVGDSILFTKNNYDKGYYNGGEGKIISATSINGNLKVGVDLDGERIFLEKDELCDIEPAFAMTAHKAQGSECDYAVIIVPKQPAALLLRKLLYVEITRAKKQVVILSEGNAYVNAITGTYQLNRNTGLKEKMIENFFI